MCFIFLKIYRKKNVDENELCEKKRKKNIELEKIITDKLNKLKLENGFNKPNINIKDV
jgi:hypothetical protein